MINLKQSERKKMAKAKETAVKDDGTIKRQPAKKEEEPKPEPTLKATPKASDVEKVESFTEFFRNDAQDAAQVYINDNPDFKIISVVETDAGDAGTTVTVTYK